jgi:hypothetical protein
VKDEIGHIRRGRVLGPKANRSAGGWQAPCSEQSVPKAEDCTEVAGAIQLLVLQPGVVPLVEKR